MVSKQLNKDMFKKKHQAVAVLSMVRNSCEILNDSIGYFAELPQHCSLKSFLDHEDKKVYINEHCKLKYHLNTGIQDKVAINVTDEENQYIINFYYCNDTAIYIYCVDMISESTIFLDVKEQVDEFDGVGGRQSLTNIMVMLCKNGFFDYDVEKDIITFYKDFFMSKPYSVLTTQECLERRIIDKDVEVFQDFVDSMRNGEVSIFDFRLLAPTGKAPWVSVLYDITFKDGKPVKAYGIVKDIDAEVKYRFRSERDLLTGCYNKVTAEDLITDLLKGNFVQGTCYLLLIDIDNFKSINDNLGHAYGDLILTTLAERLTEIFREVDIVARIGGDEFLVFLKNFKLETVLADRLDKIISAFNNTYSDGTTTYEISASIGVACYPRDGDTFKQLSKKADIAMYNAKRHGKNQYAIYDSKLDIDSVEAHITRFETIKRNSGQFIDVKICFSIFQMLYDSHDINDSINQAFEAISKLFQIDRCYVMRLDPKTNMFFHQHEWCKEGIPHSNAEPVSFEYAKVIIDKYDEKGIGLFTTDKGVEGIFEEDNTKSMLNCSIKKGNNINLVIGYDKCTETSEWEPKTINSLVFLSKIIGVYLVGRQIEGGK
ncbi:MAG: hypothetical protein ATN35_09105 [Epulopiscium sp. Nele67-Bin004]|nr:MAG: hypothetical protein ATN35_09105 [Epulopiscium sp. Nele67-Bin004]